VPNANIFVTSKNGDGPNGKIWFGDLDVQVDERALISISRLLNRKLFILTEADGRWGQEAISHQTVIRRAVATIWRGHVTFSKPADPHGGSWW
jgi:hypothetical protein